MSFNSPLGQYAPLVATIAALVLIGCYMIALLFGATLAIPSGNMEQLQSVALVAVGAVFGSAVSVNGWKQPLTAIHRRTDAIESQVSVLAAATGTPVPPERPA